MSKARIALVSNYNIDNFTESFLNIPPLENGDARLTKIASILNSIDPSGEIHYKVVNANYELKTREA